ncbi:MAG: hypothetical protein ACUVR0_00720 [Candidatus Aminicenantales bacterium]
MQIYRPRARLAFLPLALALVAFPDILASSQVEAKRLEPREKQVNYQAKPGRVIYIGVIPPEIPEEPLTWKKEVTPEKTREQELSWEEIARLRQRRKELERERQILTGDFYGINQYGYRYAMVFDRLGYIRFRLHQVETEIAEIRKKLAARW